jgi:hypothetical protein
LRSTRGTFEQDNIFIIGIWFNARVYAVGLLTTILVGEVLLGSNGCTLCLLFEESQAVLVITLFTTDGIPKLF